MIRRMFPLSGTTAATTTMAMSQFTVVPTTIALGTGAAALNPASLGLGLAALGILGQSMAYNTCKYFFMCFVIDFTKTVCFLSYCMEICILFHVS